MRVVSFYGLRRSGIHAVLEWLTHSLGDGEERIELEENRIVKYGGAAYLNDCSTWDQNKIKEFIESCKLNFIIVSYEDTNLNFSFYEGNEEPIVLVRDIKNLAASRIRSWKEFNEEILEKWLEHANANKNCKLIKYEDWLINKDYRDNFISFYDKKNLDKIDYVSKFGGGSSFVGRKLDKTEKLLNRYKQIGFSENLKSLFEKQKVIETRKLLGYECG